MSLRTKQIASLVAAGCALFAFAPSAGAATTIGSSCAADDTTGQPSFSPSVHISPVSGVVTSITITYPSAMPGAPTGFFVATPTGTPGQRQVASTGTMIFGGATAAQTANVRFPIAGGDALIAYSVIPVCDSLPTTVSTTTLSEPPATGMLLNISDAGGSTPAFSAVVEPDVDGDGFGDESQDGCPQSAALTGPCVTATPSAARLSAKNAFKLLVTSDEASVVVASASVTLPPANGTKKRKKLTFKSKGVVVTPGLLTVVKLSYPSRLKAALKGLSRKKSLKLSIKVTFDGPVDGPVDAAVLSYKQTVKGGAK